MNRGVLQSSVMQQMMGSENPNWWNMMNISGSMRSSTITQHSSPNHTNNSSSSSNILFPHSSLPFPSNCYYDAQDHHLIPESWSQLLLGGLVGEDDQKGCMGMFQSKKLEDWEEEILNSNNNNTQHQQQVDVKKEHSPHASSYVYGHGGGGSGGGGVGGGVGGDDYQLVASKQNWSPMIQSSSPQSCVTSFSSNMLDFSNNNNNNKSLADHSRPRNPPQVLDRSSECNSNVNGGAVKKARVQSSSNQTTFKVRKEKLGDRITALHQLVSPFGKTDTASVLLEAIGYIRFLQSQIEALSLPYLGNTSGSTRQHQHQQHSLLNENCLKRKGVSEQEEEGKKDLRSRGLCLVPVSCTLQVGSDNGADYWAPAFGGGGGGGVFR
ncbi:transcription factor bHLH68 isoform X2 [Cucumis sativus]|uniref:transcription factor bHLH68 isoform X2 n=1 Tax=Cucumis sativus TaxID=3659 RepID=UPI0012F4F35F|nr:transcription factor bHLH68 isoform X2 [Cucumis sativus]